MTESGVIPRPEDRRPRAPFSKTGKMDAGPVHVVFGAEGETVVVVTHEDIVLGPEDQDLFARHLFRAMALAEDAAAMYAAEAATGGSDG